MTSSLKRFKVVSLSPTVLLLWCTTVFPFNVLKVMSFYSSFPPFYSRRKKNHESMTVHVDMNLLMLSRGRLLFFKCTEIWQTKVTSAHMFLVSLCCQSLIWLNITGWSLSLFYELLRLGLLISKITITMSIYGNVREEFGVSGWVILMTHISYNADHSSS